jgi:heme O synthase-like polyprenyltransferase
MKTEAIFNSIFPATMLGILILATSLRLIPLPLGYISIVLMIISVVCLFYARLPLYKKKKFLTIGPKDLDQNYRKLYYFSYSCLAIAVVLAVLLITTYKP